MDINNVTSKINNGTKEAAGKIKPKKKNILSDEEIAEICNKPLSKVLKNVVEVICADNFNHLFLQVHENVKEESFKVNNLIKELPKLDLIITLIRLS